MNKQELVEEVSTETGLTKAASGRVVSGITDAITDALARALRRASRADSSEGARRNEWNAIADESR